MQQGSRFRHQSTIGLLCALHNTKKFEKDVNVVCIVHLVHVSDQTLSVKAFCEPKVPQTKQAMPRENQ